MPATVLGGAAVAKEALRLGPGAGRGAEPGGGGRAPLLAEGGVALAPLARVGSPRPGGRRAGDDGMATRQHGALGLLCQYSNANPEAVGLALDQGETVVFTGDGYEIAVRLTVGVVPLAARGGSIASTGSEPTTSSGDPRTSGSGGSFPSGSWSLGDDLPPEPPAVGPPPPGQGVAWVDPVWWPPPPGWDPSAPWPPPPAPWGVHIRRRE